MALSRCSSGKVAFVMSQRSLTFVTLGSRFQTHKEKTVEVQAVSEARYSVVRSPITHLHWCVFFFLLDQVNHRVGEQIARYDEYWAGRAFKCALETSHTAWTFKCFHLNVGHKLNTSTLISAFKDILTAFQSGKTLTSKCVCACACAPWPYSTIWVLTSSLTWCACRFGGRRRGGRNCKVRGMTIVCHNINT